MKNIYKAIEDYYEDRFEDRTDFQNFMIHLSPMVPDEFLECDLSV